MMKNNINSNSYNIILYNSSEANTENFANDSIEELNNNSTIKLILECVKYLKDDGYTFSEISSKLFKSGINKIHALEIIYENIAKESQDHFVKKVYTIKPAVFDKILNDNIVLEENIITIAGEIYKNLDN